MPLSMISLRLAYESGAKTKSFWCQPEANDKAVLPFETLSIIDHSSAMRIGLCRGTTTLPAQILSRVVSRASAAASTDGLGETPPIGLKWRSGSHTDENPF